jgi:predicted  nucleic acid-binding Zn-ribbon protein
MLVMRSKDMKLFCCDACKYLFESNKEEIVQCPDCGKLKVRPANKEEIKEFQDRVLEAEDE